MTNKFQTITFIIALILLNNFALCTRKFKSKASCGVGFGFDGKCINTATGLTSYSMPSNGASNILNNIILPLIQAVSAAPSLCLGDFTGTKLTDDTDSFASYTCDSLPLDTNYKYGAITALVRNVPCGTPQTVAMCMVFDQCGTFGISLNGGVAACAATYSTGIGAVLGAVADALDYIAFSISATKKLTETFTIVYNDGTNINTKSVTTRGHAYMSLGLSFPADWLKINGKSLEDIVSLKLKAKLLVDFGNVSSVFTSFVSQLDNMNSTTAKSMGTTILNLGSEVTAIMEGSINIELENLTNGFIQDFEVTIASANLLISRGGGESGMSTGMYLYLGSDVAEALIDTIQDFIDHFSSVMGFVGFDIPSVPSSGTSAGIFIQTGSMGIQINLAGVTLKCIFYYGSKGSCQFSDKYFTALINAGKWVIKKASKFFDETGDEIGSFAMDTANFAKNLSNTVADKTKQIADAAAAAAKKAAEDAANASKKAAEDAAAASKKAAEDAANAAKNAAKSVKKKLKKWF
jgi:hypothetical protein